MIMQAARFCTCLVSFMLCWQLCHAWPHSVCTQAGLPTGMQHDTCNTAHACVWSVCNAVAAYRTGQTCIKHVSDCYVGAKPAHIPASLQQANIPVDDTDPLGYPIGRHILQSHTAASGCRLSNQSQQSQLSAQLISLLQQHL